MTDYVVTAPDGKRYRVSAPEGTSQEDVLARVQKQHGGGETPSQLGTGAAGLASGWMSPARGAGQIIEKTTGFKNAPEHAWSAALNAMYGIDIPAERLRSWEDDLQKYARKTGTGRTGEFVGSILPMLMPFLGEIDAGAAGVTTLGRALGPAVGDVRLANALHNQASPIARLLARPGAKAAIESGASAGLQPVEDEKNFGWKKAGQVGGGLVTGGVLGTPAGQSALSWLAAHVPVHGIASALGYHMSPWAALAGVPLGRYGPSWGPWGWLSRVSHGVQERVTDPAVRAIGGSSAARKGVGAAEGAAVRYGGAQEKDDAEDSED